MPRFIYGLRGIAKSALGDKKGAISDYNIAIRINSQYATIYGSRGIAKYELGDKTGAIADLNIAAQLFKAQNNQDWYDRAMNLIQQMSN